MRNKTKTLFIGGAFACIGSLSGHGETFREKLDAYFAEHAQEFKDSIQAWDKYNQYESEYHITEQELKDAVMRSYGETIDWMKRSMQHQIRFFDYYRAYLRDKFTEKKIVFNKLCEKFYDSAWESMDDVPHETWQKLAVAPTLIKYKEACVSWNPDSQEPSGLKKHLETTVKTREDFFEDLKGANYFKDTFGNVEPALYNGRTRYSIERMGDFFHGVLENSPYVFNWADEKTAQEEMLWKFQGGYVTWSKWNPKGYWTSYHSYGPCATYQYPEYCLSENYGARGLVDDLFKNDDLVKAYCRIALLLPECINDACRLYRMYRETLAGLSAIKAGKLKKTQDWYGKVLKRCKALFRYWTVQHYMPIIAVADSPEAKRCNDFKTVADALTKIEGCLKELHNKVEKSIDR